MAVQERHSSGLIGTKCAKTNVSCSRTRQLVFSVGDFRYYLKRRSRFVYVSQGVCYRRRGFLWSHADTYISATANRYNLF